ncbi:MAG: murein L,D-transpeptidase [Alphaproteobacteria bacterium]|jgi:murein L,D-transpeptidase YafK|nr:murein L,D-transpeptidase [Alphaproteobacteria bacterium]QQS56917.1 MAG: murein L,D-transpeptidase [Alphaproteobacteria bacterium]
MKTRSKIALALLLLALLGAGFYAYYAMIPGKADLNEIRARVWPKLQNELDAFGLAPGGPLFIRIFKQEKELEIWGIEIKSATFRKFKTYPICTYSGSLGPKQREGDFQSPEGFYDVTRDRLNPRSNFHLAFDVGYPNAYDRAQGRTGSFIMVHGACMSIGCFAMTNEGIEEIYLLVESALNGGQASLPVHIFPFRMTDENMKAHEGDKWITFWKNLKEGYDLYETSGEPPKAETVGQSYSFIGRI